MEDTISLDQLNTVLENLKGMTLTGTTRAANMECFKINCSDGGLDISADDKGKYAFHLQAPWRITDENAILVGSHDLYVSANSKDYDPDFEWDKPNASKRDVKLYELIKNKNLIITSAIADSYGGLKIYFEDTIILEIFANESVISEYTEHWRLLDNDPENASHYVSGNKFYRI